MDHWIKGTQQAPRPQPAAQTAICTAPACKICTISSQMLPSWRSALEPELTKEYMKRILTSLHNTPFYPQPTNILRALSYFEIQESKVVILGQDPYHGEQQAMGLAFSVPRGHPVPPSLRNIYKEIDSTIGYTQGPPKHGSLTAWAKQGVLLLNATLTVAPSSPGSHSTIGWDTFTDCIIRTVSECTTGTVFILWGADAKKKQFLIDSTRHCVLTASHPSPLSATRGFFGCDHFRRANQFLATRNKDPVDWTRSD